MDDYISREEARDLMYQKQEALTEYDLDSIPAADVAPVRHGHWVKGRYGECTCSNCMMGIQRKADGWKTEWVDLSGIPFCPACGAKMDGGDASENQTTEAGET